MPRSAGECTDMISIEHIKRTVLVELRDDEDFRRAFVRLIADDIREVLEDGS